MVTVGLYFQNGWAKLVDDEVVQSFEDRCLQLVAEENRIQQEDEIEIGLFGDAVAPEGEDLVRQMHQESQQGHYPVILPTERNAIQDQNPNQNLEKEKDPCEDRCLQSHASEF